MTMTTTSNGGWNDNFKTDSSLNSRFSIRWGDSSETSFSSSGVTVKSDGKSAGFMTSDQGASQSYGYGTYSATFSMPSSAPAGAYVCLWPASNVWPGPEIDLVEKSGSTGFLTVHWKGSNGANDYKSTSFSADLSQPTTVSANWQSGSLTFNVNGKQVAQYLAGGSVSVPKDAAHGGQNEAFGVGNVGPSGASVTISDMSYTPTGSTATVAAAAAPTPSPVATTTVPAVMASPIIAVSNPAMQFVASPSAGANASITMSDPGLKNIYAVVMTSGNVAESGWQEFATNTAGSATHTFHFEHSGDYILAINDPSKIVDKGYSGHIVIAQS